MAGRVCVDANVVLKILTPEDLSPQADALWAEWISRGIQPIAPPIFPYEVCSVLRQKAVLRGELSPEREREALDLFLSLMIETRSPEGHPKPAWDLAVEMALPTVYDAAYLALAQNEGCAFWTADRRFYNTVRARFDFVHWLGDCPVSEIEAEDEAEVEG